MSTRVFGKCRAIVLLAMSAAQIIAGVSLPRRPLWLTLPEKHWAFTIESEGLEIKRNEVGSEKPRAGSIQEKLGMSRQSRSFFGVFPDSGLNMSVFIEREGPFKNAAELRDLEWPESRVNYMNGRDYKAYSRGDVAYAEITMDEFKGKTVHHHSLHAYWIKEDCWIEVHLSKEPFTEKDRKLFEDEIASVHVMPGSDAKVVANWFGATEAYNNKKYKEAIVEYALALEAEKRGRTLDLTLWRVLIDNLGMAYGVTGELKKSQETFEYGIHEDAEYSMFYYNLGCTFAEQGKLEPALDNLRKAYARKANHLPGEGMPDARADDSFRNYLKDPKFIALMNELLPVNPATPSEKGSGATRGPGDKGPSNAGPPTPENQVKPANVIVNSKDGYLLDFPEGWKEVKSDKAFDVRHPDGSTFFGFKTEEMPNVKSVEVMSLMLQLTSRATGLCEKQPVDEFEFSGQGWDGKGFHCNNLPNEKTPSSETIGLSIKRGVSFYQFVLLKMKQDWNTDKEKTLSFLRSLRFRS